MTDPPPPPPLSNLSNGMVYLFIICDRRLLECWLVYIVLSILAPHSDFWQCKACKVPRNVGTVHPQWRKRSGYKCFPPIIQTPDSSIKCAQLPTRDPKVFATALSLFYISLQISSLLFPDHLLQLQFALTATTPIITGHWKLWNGNSATGWGYINTSGTKDPPANGWAALGKATPGQVMPFIA